MISERKNHCETLYEMLQTRDIEARLLTGDVKNEERKDIVAELGRGHVKVLVATSQLVGEGFDCKGLSSVFLTTPVKYRGRLTQYIGRILRTATGKDTAVVYDYVDKTGVLQASFKSRCDVYRHMGSKKDLCHDYVLT